MKSAVCESKQINYKCRSNFNLVSEPALAFVSIKINTTDQKFCSQSHFNSMLSWDKIFPPNLSGEDLKIYMFLEVYTINSKFESVERRLSYLIDEDELQAYFKLNPKRIWSPMLQKKVKFHCQQPSMILETKGARADFPYGKYDSWLPREYFLLFIFFFTWRYTVEKGTLFLQLKSGNSACDSDIKRKLKGSCLGKKNLNCLTTLPLRSSK